MVKTDILQLKWYKKMFNKGHYISLATIYNCLNKFVNVGLLKQIENKGRL